MADAFAQLEDAEMEALLSMIETEDGGQPHETYESAETPYASDDEEYERLFLEVINEEECGSQDKSTQNNETHRRDHEMMDMT